MPPEWKKKRRKKVAEPTHSRSSVWVSCSCGKKRKSKLFQSFRAADEWLMAQHADGTTTCRITTKGKGK